MTSPSGSLLPEKPMAVIGAGIIGVAIAHALQQRGRSVVLIDRDEPGRGASFGNMASIAITEFTPSSGPSVWAQLPGWLADPEGPIRLDPRYMLRMVPWFLRFLAASRPSRVRALESAGAALCHRVYEDLNPLLQETGLESMLATEGTLMLYADEAEFAFDRDHIEMLDRFGFAYEVLGGNALRDLEPALSTSIKRAVLLPQNRTVSDPYKLVLAILDRFTALGGTVEMGDVAGFERGSDGVTAVRLAGGERLEVEGAILCAGAFTGKLAKDLGEPIPLETERGYHTQIMAPGIPLRHALIRPAKAFMVTPTAGGIRIGGTVEMAGLAAPPDYRRSKITVKRAKEVLPDLQVSEVTEWMGHRPALPDTVPIISRSAKTKGVFYATGHGHLGLTYAATTGRLIADLVTDKPPPLDMAPYRVDRF